MSSLLFQFLWNSVLGFDKNQIDHLPEDHAERLRRLGLGGGKKDLWELDDQMVWDLLRIKKDKPTSD
jgi:hypothetical protein